MLILVDTSVWIDHLRQGVPQLAQQLTQGQVATHPFIIGELACGNLNKRHAILGYLDNLEKVKQARHKEVLHLIEKQQLMGKGIGYIDAHLLASCLLTQATRLWTRDKRLNTLATTLELNYDEQQH